MALVAGSKLLVYAMKGKVNSWMTPNCV